MRLLVIVSVLRFKYVLAILYAMYLLLYGLWFIRGTDVHLWFLQMVDTGGKMEC